MKPAWLVKYRTNEGAAEMLLRANTLIGAARVAMAIRKQSGMTTEITAVHLVRALAAQPQAQGEGE